MVIRFPLMAIAVAAAFAGAPLSHACEAEAISVRAVPSDTVRIRNYKPFGAAAVEPIELAVANTGSSACDAVLLFKHPTPDAAAHRRGVLRYVIRESGALQQNLLAGPTANGASPTKVISLGEIQGGEEIRLTRDAVVEAGQIVSAGVYRTRPPITVEVYDRAAPLTPVASKEIILRTRVRPQAILTLAGAARGSKLDFGVMATGDRKRVVLTVRSNEKFRLTMSSSNGGALVHSEDDKWRVDYEIRHKDMSWTLEADETEVHSGRASRRVAGNKFRLDVTLGETGNVRAGKYRDELSITVTQIP